jgi:hypothetical protein
MSTRFPDAKEGTMFMPEFSIVDLIKGDTFPSVMRTPLGLGSSGSSKTPSLKSSLKAPDAAHVTGDVKG